MELFKIFGTIGLKGVDSAEKDLNKVTDTAEKSSSKMSKLGGFMKGVGKGVLLATGAVVTGAGALLKSVSSSYGALQQSIGGIETLFKDSADKVIENANNAFKTAGISANDYMQQVTSFSASLLQAVGGDTEKACNSADMAIRDMADNANKMGTSMEMIQNAYQGFSKQNYTMLDNLKLGYGGTKTEMERLLKDAEKLSGQKYDISNLDDVYQAIHVIQGEIGITGTTAKEGAETVEGSFNSLGASWQNFIAGLGDPNADMKTLVDNLAGGIKGAINNVTPIIENMVKALPGVVDALINTITELLPTMIDTFTELLVKVIDSVVKALPTIIPFLVDCLLSVTNAIVDNLPMIVKAVLEALIEIIRGVAEALPTLVPQLVQVILEIVGILLDNIDLIVDVGIQLMEGLIDGIIQSIPVIIEKLPQIIEKIVKVLIADLPRILNVGRELALQLALGLVKAIPQIVASIPQIVGSIITGFKEGLSKLFGIGEGAVGNFLNGIKNAWGNVVSWIKDHFKLPHFKFEGSWNPMDWGNGNFPHVGVDWYAKGGVMTKPTVFGMNGNNAMVGGEAGAEAIAPISTLQTYIKDAINSNNQEYAYTMTRIYDLLASVLPELKDKEYGFSIDGKELVRATIDRTDTELGNRSSRKARFGV